MHVQIYEVTITTDSTRKFQVPVYDVPILKSIWKPEVGKKPDLYSIVVRPSGQVEPRSFYDEKIRVMREYHTAGKTGDRPAWQDLYQNEDDLLEAWQAAVVEGTEIFQASEKAAAAAAAKAAKAAKE